MWEETRVIIGEKKCKLHTNSTGVRIEPRSVTLPLYQPKVNTLEFLHDGTLIFKTNLIPPLPHATMRK